MWPPAQTLHLLELFPHHFNSFISLVWLLISRPRLGAGIPRSRRQGEPALYNLTVISCHHYPTFFKYYFSSPCLNCVLLLTINYWGPSSCQTLRSFHPSNNLLPTRSRNEHADWDPTRNSRLQEIPSRFLLPDLFYVLVTPSLPPFPSPQARNLPFFALLWVLETNLSVEHHINPLAFGPLGFRQREAPDRDQRAAGDEIGVFLSWFLPTLVLCLWQ